MCHRHYVQNSYSKFQPNRKINVDTNLLKMDLHEVGGGRGDWMELAQDRDRWRALVRTVRDFRLP